MATDDGEASAVLQALSCACSQDPRVLRVGEEQLKKWEKERGYYSALARVLGSRHLGAEVRWMAVTCLKNGVDRYWRPGAPNCIDEDEKAFVRTTLLQCLEEPVPQVLKQLAVLVARIARMDCPARWSELLPALSEGVHSPNPLLQKCSLWTLKDVVKCLAARRLAPDRKVFSEITTSLFAFVLRLWSRHLQESGSLAGSPAQGSESLEMARVCLKILKVMVVHGFPRFNMIIEALDFIKELITQIPNMLELRHRLLCSGHHPASAVVGKTAVLMAKTLCEVQAHQPLCYVSFIAPSLELISSLLFTPAVRGQLFDQLIITCLNLLRQIVMCEDYKPPSSVQVMELHIPNQVLEAHQTKADFFKSSTCEQVCQQLVGHYMVLTQEELQCLVEEPEEFLQEKVGENYQFSLRESAEAVLLSLVHEFQQTFASFLLAMMHSVAGSGPQSGSEAILLKEAVYKAVGLAAYDLYDEVDYNSWYFSHLLPELQITDTTYLPVRHRVVWLMGTWVGVKMSESLRPSLYSHLNAMLEPSQHLSVRIAAADAMRMAVDDFVFSVQDFRDFLPESMKQLFQLLCDVTQPETKLRVLNVLSLVIEVVRAEIQPHLPALLQYLPQLWVESGKENSSLLRCVILGTLSHIVAGLGPLSAGLYSFILPVVQFATDTSVAEHVYLTEDGLELWLATLKHSPSPSAELLALVGNAVGLLGLELPSALSPSPSSSSSTTNTPSTGLIDMGTDGLMKLFRILDAYVIVFASDPGFIEKCGSVIASACSSYLFDVKHEGAMSILELLDHLVLIFPLGFQCVLGDLFLAVVHNLLVDEQTNSMITSSCLALLSRVLLQDSSFLLSVLTKMATQTHQEASDVFGRLLDLWVDKLDSMSNLQHRKLTGLAMASLLPLPDMCVTMRFEVIINMCLEVLHDVSDYTEDGVLFDALVNPSSNASNQLQNADSTELDKKRMQLLTFDPVHSVCLHRLLADRLQECMATHGELGYHKLMRTVDTVIREQLFEFLPSQQAPRLLAFSLD